MCLIEEWNMFIAGIIVAIIGFIILISIILIYRKTHPKKEHKPVDKKLLLTWIVGIVGALIMGFGMSKVLVEGGSKTDIIIGMVCGIVGLITCVLNYPIYSYIKNSK